MRVFFASILLFCYALTCIGATVNMHRCHGNTMLALQEGAESQSFHDICPLCQKHETQTPHGCDSKSEEDCCQDVRIDLTKDRDEAENVQASAALPVLSPAVITLAWIMALRPGTGQNLSAFPPDRLSARPPSVPTYLAHCNFRI